MLKVVLSCSRWSVHLCVCVCVLRLMLFFMHFCSFDIFTYSKNVMVLGSGNEVSQVKTDDRPP